MVSVIIPIFNERKNLPGLIAQLCLALSETKQFELIFIDDNSTDGSLEYLNSLNSQLLPVRVFRKTGTKGKAYSLLEGFIYAKGSVIVMIDADLQYPPAAVPKMINQLLLNDIVVGNRKTKISKFSLRRALSVIYKIIFGRLILGLPFDIQSGLKVFKKEVLKNIPPLSPTPWGFDYEFLYRAKQAGFSIGQVDIPFDARQNGVSNINFLTNGWELAAGAVKLRLASIFQRIPQKKVRRKEKLTASYLKTHTFIFLMFLSLSLLATEAASASSSSSTLDAQKNKSGSENKSGPSFSVPNLFDPLITQNPTPEPSAVLTQEPAAATSTTENPSSPTTQLPQETDNSPASTTPAPPATPPPTKAVTIRLPQPITKFAEPPPPLPALPVSPASDISAAVAFAELRNFIPSFQYSKTQPLSRRATRLMIFDALVSGLAGIWFLLRKPGPVQTEVVSKTLKSLTLKNNLG